MSEEKKTSQTSIFDLLGELKEKAEPQESADKPADKPAAKPSSSRSGSFTTKNGYEPFEVVSAIQKMIRRGKEEEAMFWVLELEDTNPSWLWKRLMVIATEDIGLANPSAVMLTKTLWDTYEKMKNMGKKRKPEGHILGLAVLTLCRSPKNREADDFASYTTWRKNDQGWREEIPDVALDNHTRRGKQMGRDANFWYAEASRLKNRVVIDGNRWEKAWRGAARDEGYEVDHDHDGAYEEE